MGFYYISVIGIALLGIVYGVLLLIFLGVARLTRGMPGRKALLGVVGAVFLVLPVAEELWIAWNFGQACKEAGTVIYKKAKVEGFYDDTTHWWRQLAESKYQFVESRDNLYGTLWRVERVGDEIKHFKIDRPTARYHYTWPNRGTRVAHKVGKTESLVMDTNSGDVIARHTAFGRRPPWFFVGLDASPYACDAPGRWPYARNNPLIYRDALIPAGNP